MATAVKAKPKKKSPKTPKAKPAKPAPKAVKRVISEKKAAVVDGAPPLLLDLPLDQVVFSPLNPRKTFDDATLKELGASIKEHGQIQPILVTPLEGGKYELIAGERRLRACQFAKLPTIRAEVRTVEDRRARILRLIENFDREDLNAIDQALAFQEATTEGGMTQQELAQSLRLTQPVIANAIRLLQLPGEWRKRIISQEITPTHGRALVPWAKYPAVLKILAEELTSHKKDEGAPLTGEDWEEYIAYAVRKAGRSMATETWATENPRKFQPTKEQLAELDIKKLGKSEYAMNVVLWDGLQAEAKQKQRQQDDEEDAKEAELTPEQKREAAKAKAEAFNKKLYRYKVGWLQVRIAAKLESLDAGGDVLLSRLMLFACVTGRSGDNDSALQEVMETAGHKVKNAGAYSADWWKSLFDVPTKEAGQLVRLALARWVRNDVEKYHVSFTADIVEKLAEVLKIDIEKSWALDRQFLELHTASQLLDLHDEWQLACCQSSMKRAELLDWLEKEGAISKVKCPRSLANVKSVKLTP